MRTGITFKTKSQTKATTRKVKLLQKALDAEQSLQHIPKFCECCDRAQRICGLTKDLSATPKGK